MSVVTNLILSVGFRDQQLLNDVNQFFGPDRGLVGLDDPSVPRGWYGGTKFLEAHLYLGAFNHLDLHAFVKHLQGLKWHDREQVQPILREQEDFAFRVVSVFPMEFAQADRELIQDFRHVGPFPPDCLAALQLGGVPNPASTALGGESTPENAKVTR